MNVVKTALLASVALLMMATVASAQDSTGEIYYPFSELRSLSIGLVIIGAAMGIGGLTKSSVESMARQPEMAGNIRGALVLAAALIEGLAFFALILIGFLIKTHPA